MCSEEARNFSYVYFACLSEKEKRGDKNLIREETGKRERGREKRTSRKKGKLPATDHRAGFIMACSRHLTRADVINFRFATTRSRDLI